jgi:hypothetical protein
VVRVRATEDTITNIFLGVVCRASGGGGVKDPSCGPAKQRLRDFDRDAIAREPHIGSVRSFRIRLRGGAPCSRSDKAIKGEGGETFDREEDTDMVAHLAFELKNGVLRSSQLVLGVDELVLELVGEAACA